jgi:hypothetical protein
MTDKPISLYINEEKGYINLIYDRSRETKLGDHLYLFDIEDYLIYKKSNRFRKINDLNDFYNFKYSGYILFRKDLYNDEDINEWLELIATYFSTGSFNFKYLSKPFPPNSILKKIKIIQ